MGGNHISEDINKIDKKQETEVAEQKQTSTKKTDVKINMRGIKSDPDDLLSIIGELQEKLRVSRKQARNYKLERDSLKREKEEQSEIPVYTGEIGSVEEMAKERDTMKQKAIELQAKVSKLNGVNGDLEDKVKELTAKLKEYDSSTLTEDYAKLQDEFDTLFFKYNSLQNRLQSNEQSNTQIAQQSEQIATLESELKESQSKVSALTEELQSRTEELSHLDKQLSETNKELKELKDLNLEYKNALNTKEQLITELQTEKSKLSDALSSLQAEVEVSATNLVSQSDLDERDGKIKHLEKNVAKYQERIHRLEDEITKFQNESLQSEEKSIKLQEELANTQSELASTQGELAVTKGELSSSESKVTKLQNDLVNAQNELKDNQDELTKANIELDQLRDNVEVAISKEDKRKLIMHDVIKIVNDTQATILSKHKKVEKEVLAIIQSDRVRNQLIKLNEELEKLE